MAKVSALPSDGCGAADFRERFSTSRRVPREHFERALFFDCARLHTLLVALLVDDPPTGLFLPDRQLIARAARARTMEEVRSAIAEFLEDPANGGWMRRIAGVRISTRRLARIAEQCLAAEDSPSKIADGDESILVR